MAWQALLLTIGLQPGVAAAAQNSAESPPPRLLLLLTIDQARGDYLDRFRPVLTGGLATVYDNGIVFADAHQHHAYTVTAAGHASLSTGLYPGQSGMVGNSFYDRAQKRHVYCVEDSDSSILPPDGAHPGWRGGAGRSPKQLLSTGLADWVQHAIPDAKVYSVGGKDRSAVLMGGKSPDGVFWYDARSGQWVSSQHYYEAYPEWVRAFHRRRPADAYRGRTWSPLSVDETLLSRMEIDATASFPKALGRASLIPDAGFYNGLFTSPFIESHLIHFAKELVAEEALGRDDSLDVLALSFSSVDTVGHEFGPNSREVLDTVMRLDRELQSFFDFLDESVGMSRVAIMLSADHGVAPLPAKNAAMDAERTACFQAVGQRFEERFGRDEWFVEPFYFDVETLARRSVSRTDLESFFVKELAACPGVVRVWTRSEIERADSSEDEWFETLSLYANSFHPERSPDLYVQYEEFLLPGRSAGTTHGSPYRYDTHVIAAIVWPGAEARRVDDTIATVDLSVTLAALLGIDVPGVRNGQDRSALIRGQRSPSQ